MNLELFVNEMVRTHCLPHSCSNNRFSIPIKTYGATCTEMLNSYFAQLLSRGAVRLSTYINISGLNAEFSFVQYLGIACTQKFSCIIYLTQLPVFHNLRHWLTVNGRKMFSSMMQRLNDNIFFLNRGTQCFFVNNFSDFVIEYSELNLPLVTIF